MHPFPAVMIAFEGNRCLGLGDPHLVATKAKQALDKDGYKGKIGLETHLFDGTLIAAAHTSMEEIMRIVSEL